MTETSSAQVVTHGYSPWDRFSTYSRFDMRALSKSTKFRLCVWDGVDNVSLGIGGAANLGGLVLGGYVG